MTTVFCLLAVLGGGTMHLQQGHEIATLSSDVAALDFYRSLCEIRIGSSKKEVLALVGAPHAMLGLGDRYFHATTATEETWAYGCENKEALPLLGRISFDGNGSVTSIIGRHIAPPNPAVLPEPDRKRAVIAISQVPALGEGLAVNWGPRVVRAANILISLGKDGAVASLREFVRLASSSGATPDREGSYLLLRLIFTGFVGEGLDRFERSGFAQGVNVAVVPYSEIGGLPVSTLNPASSSGPLRLSLLEEANLALTTGEMRSKLIAPGANPFASLWDLTIVGDEDSVWSPRSRDSMLLYAVSQMLSFLPMSLRSDWEKVYSPDSGPDVWLLKLVELFENARLHWDENQCMFVVRNDVLASCHILVLT